MEGFKSGLIKILKHACISKAIDAKTDICWEARFINHGFSYKGMTFKSIVARDGRTKPMPDEEAKALGVDLIYEQFYQWNYVVEPALVRWLNACPTLAHAGLWFPQVLKHKFPALETNPKNRNNKLVPYLLAIKETDEYLMLESLIAYNTIQE